MAGFWCTLVCLATLFMLVDLMIPVASYPRIISPTSVSRGASDQLRYVKRGMTTSDSAADKPIVAELNTVLGDYLQEARGLGAVRFVVVGAGAILETVGSFDNLRYADTAKGKLATFSNEDNSFECHVRVAEVKEIKMVVVEKFSKILRVTRFVGPDGATLLSAILQPEDKQGSIDAWEAMRTKYGEHIKL